jgi:cobalt/nickel transport system permease protein
VTLTSGRPPAAAARAVPAGVPGPVPPNPGTGRTGTRGPTAHARDSGEHLYLPGDSLLHRLPAQAKFVAACTFVLIVVATPLQAAPAFAGYAVLLVAVAASARLPPLRVLPRMAVEVPFVAFALLLPFVGRTPDVLVLGVPLSEPGLQAAGNILAKATLGVGTSVVLAATTRTSDLLDALTRLRVPQPLVQIASFMLRFVHLTNDQWRRMARARAARGFDARGPRAWPVLARSLGVLFIRTFERGERVHLAMLSRGYQGGMPGRATSPPTPGQWAAAMVLPVAAAACLAAVVLLP